MAVQDEEQAPQRPTAVTVIGRVWLTAAILVFLVAVADLLFWEVLRPALPTLLGYASRRDPRLRFLDPFVRYYPAAKSIEAVFAAAAAVSAYHFLRLRSWARAALETASWISLLYYSGVAYLSYRIWRRASLDPSFAAGRRHAAERLVAGTTLQILVIAALVTMIVFLRGRRLRSDFGRARAVGPQAPDGLR